MYRICMNQFIANNTMKWCPFHNSLGCTTAVILEELDKSEGHQNYNKHIKIL